MVLQNKFTFKLIHLKTNVEIDDAHILLPIGILIAGEVPGNFNQRFPPLLRGVDYNIIWIDQDTAMEYDCRAVQGGEEYCVHFMSRTITIEPAKLQTMVDYAGEFKHT